MRRPVIAANWKMHMTAGETKVLAEKLLTLIPSGVPLDIVLCPPFTALAQARTTLAGGGLSLGGQNMHWEEKGAFTGEISAPMLKDLGCSHVIIGHSERRQLFGETDGQINLKLKAALAHGLIPIFCLGETLTQREENITEAICAHQLRAGLAGISRADLAGIIVAYEPIWAIGTGRTATPADAQATIGFIRQELAQMDRQAAEKMRILYGGSVKAENIDGLMAQADIDGALVGGASLQAESFAKIVNFGGLGQ